MTSHELARLLLTGPDWPIAIIQDINRDERAFIEVSTVFPHRTSLILKRPSEREQVASTQTVVIS